MNGKLFLGLTFHQLPSITIQDNVHRSA